MGISAGGGKGLKSDINVTPLVDVVLVLLIIFIINTPVMMRQITIEVPRKLEADENPIKASKQISILIRADGNAVLSDGAQDKTMPVVEMPNALRDMLKDRVTEKVVFVDFEDRLAYGEAVSAMDTIKGVGGDDCVVALKIREEAKPGTETGVAPPP
jgi:biopolymer transport protein TolR